MLDQGILHGEASTLTLSVKVIMALEIFTAVFPWLTDEVAHTMGYRHKDHTLKKNQLSHGSLATWAMAVKGSQPLALYTCQLQIIFLILIY